MNTPVADPRFGPSTLQLSNGRLVSNPLATTLRFAYANRGEGQLWTPWLHAWNLRAGRTFPLGRTLLETAIDVFNVTNNGSDQEFINGANQIDGANYGLLTNRQLPRSAQMLVRLLF
jgi:hypothetical protein